MRNHKEILRSYARPAALIAYGKINLHLAVFKKNSEAALHDLGSLFQTISLHDTVFIQPAPIFKFSLASPTGSLPVKEKAALIQDNLLIRAWKYFKQRYTLEGEIQITLVKRIPIGSGLGGGSSDVAALLVWVEAAYGLILSDTERVQVALHLGSDVAFFLKGGLAWVEGVGERIEPLPVSLADGAGGQLWVVENEIGIATQEAYARFVTVTDQRAYQQFKRSILAIINRKESAAQKTEPILHLLAETAENAFQMKTLAHYQPLRNIYENLQKHSAYTLLTGSGSAFFAYSPKPLPQELQNLPGLKRLHQVDFTSSGHEIRMDELPVSSTQAQ